MSRIVPALAAVAGGTLIAAGCALLLLPTEMEVVRTEVVAADAQTLTKLVSHYPERLSWVAWTEIDPEADYTFTGEAGAPGATMAWVGQEIGTAKLTLKQVKPGQEVVGELVYSAPFSMTSTDRVVFEPIDDHHTRVVWTASAPLNSVPDRIFGLFADSVLGPDYERGLERLAQQVERGS